MRAHPKETGAVVLVVEDEELARLIIAEYLKDDGFAVLESSSPEQALRILEARDDVRAVVLDVVMPGAMDGIALAHRIYARWPQIGLLIVSGKEIPKTTQLPPGASFLPKPYFGPSIVGRVRAIIVPERKSGGD
jgi:two-component system, response regulator PdtaR